MKKKCIAQSDLNDIDITMTSKFNFKIILFDEHLWNTKLWNVYRLLAYRYTPFSNGIDFAKLSFSIHNRPFQLNFISFSQIFDYWVGFVKWHLICIVSMIVVITYNIKDTLVYRIEKVQLYNSIYLTCGGCACVGKCLVCFVTWYILKILFDVTVWFFFTDRWVPWSNNVFRLRKRVIRFLFCFFLFLIW